MPTISVMHLKVSDQPQAGKPRSGSLAEAAVSDDAAAVFADAGHSKPAPCGEIWRSFSEFLSSYRPEKHHMSPDFSALWERFHIHAAAVYGTASEALPLPVKLSSEIVSRSVSLVTEAEYAAMWGNTGFVFRSLETASLLCLLSEGCVAFASGTLEPDAVFAASVAEALGAREENRWYLWKPELAEAVFASSRP